MKSELRTKWINALRSKKYEQCQSRLHIEDDGYCCLGVLARCAGYENEDLLLYMPSGRRKMGLADLGENFDLSSGQEITLINMNDGYGKFTGNRQSFKQIADWIESNVSTEGST